MAEVNYAKGVKLVLKVGDGGSPSETFTAKCSINAERGFTISANISDTEIPDCSDVEAVAWLAREKTGVSVTFTGSGLVNTPDIEEFFNWAKSKDTKNCKVIVDVPGASGGIIFTGAYHLGEFALTGNRGDKMSCSISLASSGAVTSAANA